MIDFPLHDKVEDKICKHEKQKSILLFRISSWLWKYFPAMEVSLATDIFTFIWSRLWKLNTVAKLNQFIPPQLKIHHNSKPIIREIEFCQWSGTVQSLTFILLKYRHRFHFSITFSPFFQSPQPWHFTMKTWYFAWIGCVLEHILIPVKKRVLLNDEWCKTENDTLVSRFRAKSR